MPFDGHMLDATLTQAVASIPGAIEKIRKYISKDKIDNSSLEEEVNALCAHISALGDVKVWLDEMKRLHEHFEDLDERLWSMKRHYIQSREYGRFSSKQYDLGAVRKHWEDAKRQGLAPVVAFAFDVKRIDRHPLRVNADGRAVAGPDWAKRLLDFQFEIDNRFLLYDQGNTTVVKEIAELTNGLHGYVRSCKFVTDERIRREAGNLGDLLANLGGELRNE